MLQVACPVCATPLFRHGKDALCAKCNHPVMILKSAEEEVSFAGQQVLDHLEQAVLEKIAEFDVAIKNERDLAPLREFGEAIKTYLSALEQIRRLKSTLFTVQQYGYTRHPRQGTMLFGLALNLRYNTRDSHLPLYSVSVSLAS